RNIEMDFTDEDLLTDAVLYATFTKSCDGFWLVTGIQGSQPFTIPDLFGSVRYFSVGIDEQDALVVVKDYEFKEQVGTRSTQAGTVNGDVSPSESGDVNDGGKTTTVFIRDRFQNEDLDGMGLFMGASGQDQTVSVLIGRYDPGHVNISYERPEYSFSHEVVFNDEEPPDAVSEIKSTTGYSETFTHDRQQVLNGFVFTVKRTDLGFQTSEEPFGVLGRTVESIQGEFLSPARVNIVGEGASDTFTAPSYTSVDTIESLFREVFYLDAVNQVYISVERDFERVLQYQIDGGIPVISVIGKPGQDIDHPIVGTRTLTNVKERDIGKLVVQGVETVLFDVDVKDDDEFSTLDDYLQFFSGGVAFRFANDPATPVDTLVNLRPQWRPTGHLGWGGFGFFWRGQGATNGDIYALTFLNVEPPDFVEYFYEIILKRNPETDQLAVLSIVKKPTDNNGMVFPVSLGTV
ncbi:MAG: hypothetical protein IBX56_08340, partial [Methylomicrobium sp.]|nr:hypothetical protein [Methylomicrobium sp.]